VNGILESNELPSFRRAHRGETIVFTNGCFDLLHRGHAELLIEAKSRGDCLVVGINSDRSVARLKGPPRPLVEERDRAFMLLLLEPVDYVTIFEEPTPLETIRKLEPDVLVKGAEYTRENIVGADFIEERGGSVVRVVMLKDYSTTGYIEKLRS
jgi:D-beta-D-heptose 7-phosphate kinase/D-beta-D-heptose 1-phosphate adenosyltransferase